MSWYIWGGTKRRHSHDQARFHALILDTAESEELGEQYVQEFIDSRALAVKTAKRDPEVSRRNLAALQAAKGNTNPINFEVS